MKSRAREKRAQPRAWVAMKKAPPWNGWKNLHPYEEDDAAVVALSIIFATP